MTTFSAPEAHFRKILDLVNRPEATGGHGFLLFARFLLLYNPLIEISP